MNKTQTVRHFVCRRDMGMNKHHISALFHLIPNPPCKLVLQYIFLCIPFIHILKSYPPKMIVLGQAFGWWSCHKGRYLVPGISTFLIKEAPQPFPPCGDTRRVCNIEGPYLPMLASGSWTFSLKNCEKKILLFISHLVCGILWQQSEWTKIGKQDICCYFHVVGKEMEAYIMNN